MTKRSRTFLFFTLALLFLVSAPTTVLYSQGYRFDWGTGQITQVGAFYFNVSPSRAAISVDNKSIATTARILGSTLTKNFLPKTYNVQISKSGYHTWEKNLEIKPRQVTEAKNIMLFPQDVLFETLLEDVEQYWKAPNRQEAIIKINAEDEWTLLLWDYEQNLKYEFYRVRKSVLDVTDIIWAPDGSRILVETTTGRVTEHFVQILDRDLLGKDTIIPEITDTINLAFLGQDIQQISFSPASDEQLIFTRKSRQSNVVLFFADAEQQELLDPIADDIVSFATREQTLFWLDEKGTVWQKDIGSSAPAEALNSIPLSIPPSAAHEFFFVGSDMFLKQAENLYRFDTQIQNFQIISVAAQSLRLSPDQRKIALSNGSEISIYFLDKETEQPSHEKGDNVFLTRFSQKIENILWINSHYIAFVLGDTIKIAEIDNRDHINSIDIAHFPESEEDSKLTFFWNPQKSMLYVHENKSIQTTPKRIQ